MLSRAEKAQRKQNALFNDDEPSSGAFALAKAKKRSNAGSSSSRPSPPMLPALKRTASTDSARSSRTGSPVGSSSSKPGSSRAASNSTANAASHNKASTSAVAYGSAKDRIAAQIAALKSPQKLNVVKRDTRTIEEIERDMRARKAKQNGTSVPSSTSSGPAIGSRPLATGNPARSSTAASQNSLGKGSATDRNGRRPRSPAYSDDSASEEDYSSSSSSAAADRPARKRARHRHERGGGNSSGLKEEQRSAIWKLMGRDRNQDLAREQEFDSDDSDMEATGEDVLREERLAYVTPPLVLDSELEIWRADHSHNRAGLDLPRGKTQPSRHANARGPKRRPSESWHNLLHRNT